MDFSDPYTGMVPQRKLNRAEILRALRIDVAAELDAINLYQAHIDAIDDERINAVIAHIRDEEKEHAAEFMQLINELDQVQAEKLANSKAEVQDAIRSGAQPVEQGQGSAVAAPQGPQPISHPEGFTVGSLMGEEQK
jgi:rubrerythrin